jgi:hypothetical protein
MPSLDVLDALADGWRRSAAYIGKDDRKKQNRPSPSVRSQRIINLIKRERRNDHEEGKEGIQGLG